MDQPKELFPHLQTWVALQKGMTDVTRWGKYRQVYPGARRQTNNEHVTSFTWHGILFLPRIKARHPSFDGELFLASLSSHDHGEAIEKMDVAYSDKTTAQDVREYNAFMSCLANLPKESAVYAERAFLLQQVEKSWEGFPNGAVRVLEELKKEHLVEARFFQGIERYDYLSYAMEHPAEHGMLIWVLRNNALKLDNLAKIEPGFGEIVWTPAHSRWAEDILQKYEYFITEDEAMAEAALRRAEIA